MTAARSQHYHVWVTWEDERGWRRSVMSRVFWTEQRAMTHARWQYMQGAVGCTVVCHHRHA